jgi:hypothetical protein
MAGSTTRAFSLSPGARRALSLIAFGFAVLGALLGIGVLVMHVATDPLADVHAYYDAGARLNSGLPLYVQPASTDEAAFYRYPPLLAILFRPLALLPFTAAAAIWEVALIACFVLTVWIVGPRRRETWLAIGVLGLPIAWCLAIGQAQVLLTLLTAIGAPWAVAAASNIKLLPAVIALYWIGRRDWRSLRLFAAGMVVLAVVQLILAPQASVDYLTAMSLDQVGHVRNISPYAISPVLWAALVAAGAIAVIRLAATRAGWGAAVALSVLASPRLLVYMLMTLIAALAGPERRERVRIADAGLCWGSVECGRCRPWPHPHSASRRRAGAPSWPSRCSAPWSGRCSASRRWSSTCPRTR